MTAVKDILEDINRYRLQRAENKRKTLAKNAKSGKFKPTEWEKLKVGQVVKIMQDEFFPADLVLLTSSIHGGIAYVETKSLDGETNLKHKKSHKEILGLC